MPVDKTMQFCRQPLSVYCKILSRKGGAICLFWYSVPGTLPAISTLEISMLMRFHSSLGTLTVAENGSALTHVLLQDSPLPTQLAGQHEASTPLLCRTREAILAYLDGQLKDFDLPLAPQGTAFQQTVWRALLTIPYGQTRSYGQIAAQTGNPKACRAVGMANHNNPISLLIPCHRVIGAGGALTGYGGGLHIKTLLLNLEKQHSH